jgi:hypothetical protein
MYESMQSFNKTYYMAHKNQLFFSICFIVPKESDILVTQVYTNTSDEVFRALRISDSSSRLLHNVVSYVLTNISNKHAASIVTHLKMEAAGSYETVLTYDTT